MSAAQLQGAGGSSETDQVRVTEVSETCATDSCAGGAGSASTGCSAGAASIKKATTAQATLPRGGSARRDDESARGSRAPRARLVRQSALSQHELPSLGGRPRCRKCRGPQHPGRAERGCGRCLARARSCTALCPARACASATPAASGPGAPAWAGASRPLGPCAGDAPGFPGRAAPGCSCAAHARWSRLQACAHRRVRGESCPSIARQHRPSCACMRPRSCSRVLRHSLCRVWASGFAPSNCCRQFVRPQEV